VLEPQVTLKLEGLEALIAGIVDERLSTALAEHESDRWLTAPEAAQYLGIAVSTLHDLVSGGRLPRHGPKGSRLRFKQDDLDAYARRWRRP
jgi:excisionase family DNA binding protein